MIENMLTETCIILTQSASDTGEDDGEFVAEQEGVACRFVRQVGKRILDSAGQERVIEGYLIMVEPVTLENRISFDGWEYELINVYPQKDPYSDVVYAYRVYVGQRRLYNEEPDKIG